MRAAPRRVALGARRGVTVAASRPARAMVMAEETVAVPTGMKRYETMFLMLPDASEDELAKEVRARSTLLSSLALCPEGKLGSRPEVVFLKGGGGSGGGEGTDRQVGGVSARERRSARGDAEPRPSACRLHYPRLPRGAAPTSAAASGERGNGQERPFQTTRRASSRTSHADARCAWRTVAQLHSC